MSHYQPPPHLSKRELEEELLKLMDTYGKRLLVIERILVATREPTELVKQITNIRLENLAAKRRLESNLRVVGGLIPPETDALIDVWCITRMKLYYHKVLKENRILSEIAARWSGNPAILSLMESYNDEVFGRAAEASAKRVNVFTFPVLIKDHLLYLRDYLEQYSQRTRTFAFERILELNSWLGQDRPYLSSIRGLDLGEVFTKFRKRDEVIIEQTNMSIRGHKWELAPCTLYMSESFLVIRIPECWGPNEPIVDYAPLQDCDIEPAHDDYSLEVTGVGTTKILVAPNGTTRFQWMVAIRELKELWC